MPDTQQHTARMREQYQDATNFNARVELHRRFSQRRQSWQRWVFDHLALAPGDRVLELGCGPGYLWYPNRDRLPGGPGITLTDFSPGMLAQARGLLAPTGHPFRYAVADAAAIPFAPGSFDVVIANHMLYHVADKARTFAGIARVLAPGGRFYASTMSQDHFREVREIMIRFRAEANLDPNLARRLLFTLENGAEWLAPWFPDLTLHRFDDTLVVTEAGPLAAYVLSMLPSHVPAARREALAAFIHDEVDRSGPLHVTSATGLFIARRPAA